MRCNKPRGFFIQYGCPVIQYITVATWGNFHFKGEEEKIGEWLWGTETFCRRLCVESWIKWKSWKSNGMRRTAREKEEHIKWLEGEIEQKLQEVKSSMW